MLAAPQATILPSSLALSLTPALAATTTATSSTTASAAIINFLERANKKLKPLGANVSIDVFGLTTTSLDDMGIVESIHLTAFHWIVDNLHARIGMGMTPAKLTRPVSGQKMPTQLGPMMRISPARAIFVI